MVVTNNIVRNSGLSGGNKCHAYTHNPLARYIQFSGGYWQWWDVIGITLGGNQEGFKGIILVGVKRMRLGKRIALAGNLCLRGKVGRVGRRTLMELRVVSPINVLTHDGLRVAPDKGMGVRCLLSLPRSGKRLPGLCFTF